MGRSTGVASVACLLALAGCAGSPSEHVALPPDGAPADVVLQTYLRAVKAGDCDTARALAAPTFMVGNGELCGDVDLTDFVVHTSFARTGQDEVEYSAELTTGGSRDGSVPSGEITWFYALRHQDGRWRLTGGGSGP